MIEFNVDFDELIFDAIRRWAPLWFWIYQQNLYNELIFDAIRRWAQMLKKIGYEKKAMN